MSDSGQDNNHDLFLKVMASIKTERRRLALCRRFALASITCMAALLALYPVWNAFRAQFLSSGFSQFLSLLIWDTRSVLDNWQDYLLSLLESFPIVNAAVLLAVIWAFLVSLKFIFQYGKNLIPVRRLKTVNN